MYQKYIERLVLKANVSTGAFPLQQSPSQTHLYQWGVHLLCLHTKHVHKTHALHLIEQFELFLAVHMCSCSSFASADQPDPRGLCHGLLSTSLSYLLALQKQELNPILTSGHTCSTTGVE